MFCLSTRVAFVLRETLRPSFFAYAISSKMSSRRSGSPPLKRTRGTRDRASLVLLGGSVFLLGVDLGLCDLDVARLELALEQLGVLVADVVLEHERLELGCLELAPVLLGALDQRLQVLGLEQFDELVLRQSAVSVLSLRSFSPATNLRSVGRFSG